MNQPETHSERTLERASKFLGTLSRHGAIRQVLERGGYSADEHQEGWILMCELLEDAASSPQERALTCAALVAWLDDWSETARVLVERDEHLVALGLAPPRHGAGSTLSEGREVGAPSDAECPDATAR